jgi:hypothetical protein
MHCARFVLRYLLGATLVALLVGCGASAVQLEDGGSRDGGDDGSPGAIQCSGSSGMEFPAFARMCTEASECDIAVHQTNCCGDQLAFGIRVTERERFEQAEAVCRRMYPGCGCPSRGISTEDGMIVGFDMARIAVECRAGLCMTHAR